VSLWYQISVAYSQPIPLLGSYLSRLREYSCDRHGAFLAPHGATGLVLLASGRYTETDASTSTNWCDKAGHCAVSGSGWRNCQDPTRSRCADWNGCTASASSTAGHRMPQPGPDRRPDRNLWNAA